MQNGGMWERAVDARDMPNGSSLRSGHSDLDRSACRPAMADATVGLYSEAEYDKGPHLI